MANTKSIEGFVKDIDPERLPDLLEIAFTRAQELGVPIGSLVVGDVQEQSSVRDVMRTSDAASALNVSPNTFRSWQLRYNYPPPVRRSKGGHRYFDPSDIYELRSALEEGLTIQAAIDRAQYSVSKSAFSSMNGRRKLRQSLGNYDEQGANGTMDAVLDYKSVESTVETVLLPEIHNIADRHGYSSANWSFASRWGNNWLNHARRLSPQPIGERTVLIGDATRYQDDPDRLELAAFSLLCSRLGARVLTLSVENAEGLKRVATAFRPQQVVLAGRSQSDGVGRWAYTLRATSGIRVSHAFRRDRPENYRNFNGSLKWLPDMPGEAARTLLTAINDNGQRLGQVAAAEAQVGNDAEHQNGQPVAN